MNDSRKEFEAWADTQSGGLLRSSYTGDYDYPLGRKMFAAWNAARSADEALMREAMRALEAMQTMADSGPSPRKLDAALSWIENDRMARGMVNASITALRARLEKEGTT